MSRLWIVVLFCLTTIFVQATAAPVALEHEEIVRALHEARFADLEERLNGLQSEFEADGSRDRLLMEAIWGIGDLGDDPRIEAAFDQWIAQSPQSYAARLARGAYYVGRGLNARGSKFSSETPENQFEQMYSHFKRARSDLLKSLKLSEKPLASHYELIVMAMRSGSDKEIEDYYRRAIAFAPHAMELRVLYMSHLEPRWGGSYSAMKNYIDESEKEIGRGDQLDRLRAMIPGDQAHSAAHNERYVEAAELLGQAIALQDRSYYRCHRAFARFRLNEEELGLQDLEAGLALPPIHSYCADVLASNRSRDQYARQLGMIDRALEQMPRHAALRAQRGFILQESRNQAAAFDEFKIAADLGHAWSQMQVGKYLFSGWGGVPVDREAALALFRLAAAKGELNAQYSLAEALAYLGRHEESKAEMQRYEVMKAEEAAKAAAATQPVVDLPPEFQVARAIVSAAQWLERNPLYVALGALCVFLLLALILRSPQNASSPPGKQ